jgi:hypothetical protein
MGTNRITREVRKGQVFPEIRDLVGTNTFDQGDLLVLSAGAIRVAAVGDISTPDILLGISTQDVVSGKLKRPYTTDVDASGGASNISGPVYGVEADLVLKTGEAFNPGDIVYYDGAAGAFHVTITPPVTPLEVGVFTGPAVASAAAGETGRVHIKQTVVPGL